jgi:hypothetical protein
MGRTKAKTPAQQARAKYVEAHGLRGNTNANIWFTKCPYTGEDLVFIGDARIEHFYACVGDPDVVRTFYRIDAQATRVNGNEFKIQFDARVEFSDGRIEYRIVGAKAPRRDKKGQELEFQACGEAARRLGGCYRPVSLVDLDRLQQRVRNWRRAMRFVRACKDHPLGEAEAAVCAQLKQHKRMTIGQLLVALSDFEAPILVGAIVRLLHKRALTSDLDRELFSRHSVIAAVKESR